MYRITLIATGHKEHGICNSNELYKIIEQVNPDIIFEELSPPGFAAIYEGPRSDTLETKTIKLYLKKYPIAHFPVDLDGNELVDRRFKIEIVEMLELFAGSPGYNDLSIQLNNLSEQLGFSYLNNEQCRELLKSKHLLEEVILRNMNYEKLFQTYNRWLEINDLRENAMIRNIYKYSDLNKYKRALFLVGAEHRESIIDKIPKFERNNKLELDWNFNYFN